jgi:hypothetical protein
MNMNISWAIVLVMEAANTSETRINFHQTVRRSIQEDCHLQREELIVNE